SGLEASSAFGGGVLVSTEGSFTMTNCTLAGNQSVGDGLSQGWGGGLHVYYLSGAGSVANSIIAGNQAPSAPDVYNGLSLSGGHNLIGDGIYSNFSDGENGDRVGSAADPFNAMLAALADNG